MNAYDLILVGGTGAQFGHALLDGVSMGLVDAPAGLYVVDADRRYYTDPLEPMFNKAIEDAKVLRVDGDGGAETGLRQYVSPYAHPGQGPFSVLDVMNTQADLLPDLGEVCLTHEELIQHIDNGLFGMAKIGGVLTGLADKNSYPHTLIKKLAAQKGRPIVLAGSLAGGTGAGFLLPLVRAIRQEKRLADRPIYAFIFLPWFSLPAQDSDGIGPTNARMKLNASQGVRYASHLVEDSVLAGEDKALTSLILFGLPDNAKPPAKSGEQRSEPSPLLYYAASFLCDGFREIEASRRNLAGHKQAAVYTVRCHSPEEMGDGRSPFTGLVRFALPSKDSPRHVPFEAVDALLSAQVAALETLGTERRYEGAFRPVLDNPDYLPRALYRVIRDTRSTREERLKLGRAIADRCRKAAAHLRIQLERWKGFAGTGASPLAQNHYPEAWYAKNLKDVRWMDRHLEVGVDELRHDMKALFSSRGDEVCAELVIRAVSTGLSRVSDLAKVSGGIRVPQATSVALPGSAGMKLPTGTDGPLVELDSGAVDRLADTLVGQDRPDSQCIPSPLAAAHLSEFYCNGGAADFSPTKLHTSHAGQVVLLLAGLAAGRVKVSRRLPMREDDARDVFHEVVQRQESSTGPRPLRGEWVSIVTLDGIPVAASSPRTILFPSVRINETRKNPLLPKLRELAVQLDADGSLDRARRAYAHFILQLRQQSAAAARQLDGLPWYRLLSDWTRGLETEAQQTFHNEAYYANGPFVLQTGTTAEGEQAVLTPLWLPRLMPRAQRERLASVVASIAGYGSNEVVFRADHRTGAVSCLTRPPRPEQPASLLLEFRPFKASGHVLNPEDDLLAGSLDILAGCEGAGPIPHSVVSHEWSNARYHMRLAAGEENRQLVDASLPMVLQALYAADKNHPVPKALAVDDRVLTMLARLGPGPNAPALVNLFADLLLKS
ncbi:MAG: hypothetical protein RL199_166 [Pseudomonadota bacterium]|jgi:hypothetical protein